LAQAGIGQVGALQTRVLEIRPVELGAPKIGSRQIAPGKIESAEIRSRQALLARDLHQYLVACQFRHALLSTLSSVLGRAQRVNRLFRFAFLDESAERLDLALERESLEVFDQP